MFTLKGMTLSKDAERPQNGGVIRTGSVGFWVVRVRGGS